MQRLILLFPLFFSFSLFAQNGPVNPTSSRSNGVANASVAFKGINSLFNNQAGLADLKNTSFLLSVQETFRAPCSDSSGKGFAIPTSLGAVGLSWQTFAADDIKQSKVGLTYARKLMETLSIGIQFDMVSTQIQENERKNLVTFEIGMQYQLNEKLLLGAHLYNPAKLEITENEYLPTILRIGGTYAPHEKLLIHTEIEKDFDFPIVFKSGLEYEVINDLWVRIGFKINPTTFNFGIGFPFKKRFSFDFAAYYQRGLDLTSSGVLASSGFVPTFAFGYNIIK